MPACHAQLSIVQTRASETMTLLHVSIRRDVFCAAIVLPSCVLTAYLCYWRTIAYVAGESMDYYCLVLSLPNELGLLTE